MKRHSSTTWLMSSESLQLFFVGSGDGLSTWLLSSILFWSCCACNLLEVARSPWQYLKCPPPLWLNLCGRTTPLHGCRCWRHLNSRLSCSITHLTLILFCWWQWDSTCLYCVSGVFIAYVNTRLIVRVSSVVLSWKRNGLSTWLLSSESLQLQSSYAFVGLCLLVISGNPSSCALLCGSFGVSLWRCSCYSFTYICNSLNFLLSLFVFRTECNGILLAQRRNID